MPLAMSRLSSLGAGATMDEAAVSEMIAAIDCRCHESIVKIDATEFIGLESPHLKEKNDKHSKLADIIERHQQA